MQHYFSVALPPSLAPGSLSPTLSLSLFLSAPLGLSDLVDMSNVHGCVAQNSGQDLQVADEISYAALPIL